MRHLRNAIAVVATAAFLAACATTAQNTEISLAEERARSEEVVADLRRQNALLEDRAIAAYVDDVVERIAATRPPGSVPLRSYVVRDASVNAFTTGGGYVFFNAGLLAAMENEAQFATVAAHEIAHIDRGHVQAGQRNRQTIGIVGDLARIGAAAAGIGGSTTDFGIGLGQSYAASSFSREQEVDADVVGLEYGAEAGYDMVEGARAFEVLQRVYGGQSGPATFFASHPQSGDRLQRLQALARERGAADGRVGEDSHDRVTRGLRRDILAFLEREGREREAAQIRRNLGN